MHNIVHFNSTQRRGEEKTPLNSDQSPFQAKLKGQVLLSNQPMNSAAAGCVGSEHNQFVSGTDIWIAQGSVQAKSHWNFHLTPLKPVLGLPVPWVPQCHCDQPPERVFFNPLGSHLRSKFGLSASSPRHESLCLSARHSWAIHIDTRNFCSENGLGTAKFPGIFHKMIYITKCSSVLKQASISFCIVHQTGNNLLSLRVRCAKSHLADPPHTYRSHFVRFLTVRTRWTT